MSVVVLAVSFTGRRPKEKGTKIILTADQCYDKMQLILAGKEFPTEN